MDTAPKLPTTDKAATSKARRLLIKYARAKLRYERALERKDKKSSMNAQLKVTDTMCKDIAAFEDLCVVLAALGAHVEHELGGANEAAQRFLVGAKRFSFQIVDEPTRVAVGTMALYEWLLVEGRRPGGFRKEAQKTGARNILNYVAAVSLAGADDRIVPMYPTFSRTDLKGLKRRFIGTRGTPKSAEPQNLI